MNVNFLNHCPNGISVVFPNYNGAGLLRANLPALYNALDTCGFSSEVIVADDCSSDDSLVFLTKEYPQIQGYSNLIN